MEPIFIIHAARRVVNSTSALFEFLGVIIQLLSIAAPIAGLAGISVPAAYVPVMECINLSFSLEKAIYEEDYAAYFQTIGSFTKDQLEDAEIIKKPFDFDLDWAEKLFELSDGFGALAESIASNPNYYRELFNYCSCDPNFRVFFEYNNGTREEVSDISNKLNKN